MTPVDRRDTGTVLSGSLGVRSIGTDLLGMHKESRRTATIELIAPHVRRLRGGPVRPSRRLRFGESQHSGTMRHQSSTPLHLVQLGAPTPTRNKLRWVTRTSNQGAALVLRDAALGRATRWCVPPAAHREDSDGLDA